MELDGTITGRFGHASKEPGIQVVWRIAATRTEIIG
jgi:hypothetical protein